MAPCPSRLPRPHDTAQLCRRKKSSHHPCSSDPFPATLRQLVHVAPARGGAKCINWRNVGGGRWGDESACKPDSVPRGAVIIHLRGLLPAPFAVAGVRPTRTPRASSAQTASAGTASEDTGPSWSCSRWGLPSHPSHLGCWWSLTPPFHPYPAGEGGAVCSLWHFPAGHPGWALPTTLLCGVRTFLCSRSDHPTDSSASSLSESGSRRPRRPKRPCGLGSQWAEGSAGVVRLRRRGTPPCRPAGRRRRAWRGSADRARGRRPSPGLRRRGPAAAGRRTSSSVSTSSTVPVNV